MRLDRDGWTAGVVGIDVFLSGLCMYVDYNGVVRVVGIY